MERTIRRLFLVMALAILYISFPAAVYAENIYGGGVKIGNIYYELDEENRTAAVACPPYKRIYNLGGGYEPEYLDYYEGDIIIPETVLNDGFEYSVTTIGESAFAYQDLVSSVAMPNSITQIMSSAFSASGIESVTIPSSVKYIGSYIAPYAKELVYNAENAEFVNLGSGIFKPFGYNITKLTIGEDVKILDGRVFRNNTKLTDLYYNAIDCEITYDFEESTWNRISPFSESVTNLVLGDNVKRISDYAFCGLQNVECVVLPDSLEEIGENGFLGCGLNVNTTTSITIPKSVKRLENGSLAISNVREVIFNAECCEMNVIGQILEFPVGVFLWNTIEKLTIGNDVKRIPDRAFPLFKISTVDIPEGVESIGNEAFYGCYNLKEVNVSSLSKWSEINFGPEWSNPIVYTGKLMVNGTELPRKLNIPEGVKRIGSYAFTSYESLVSVSIPESVRIIGDGAFKDCGGLQRIVFPTAESFLSLDYKSSESHVTYGNNATIYIENEPLDMTSVALPETMTRIPDYAFCGWSDLCSIDIPESITEIGNYAFSDCSKLSSIDLPESITEIGNYAFENCSRLKLESLPSNIKEIKAGTFMEGLYGSLVIPEGVEYIGDDAFWDSGLRSVTIPSSVKYIGKSAFSYNSFHHSRSDLVDVDITSVEDWAKIIFANSSANPIKQTHRFSIKGKIVNHLDIDLENDSVSSHAFINAENLKTVRVKAAYIGMNAFKNCSGLSDVCLDVDSVSTDAFGNCLIIQSLYVPRSIPPTAHNNSFSKYDGVNLYVPVGSLDAYENAENCWWKFLDIHESDFKDLDVIFKADYGNISVESIMLTPDSWSGEEGESFSIMATILPENATDKSLTWTSDNEAVAKVDSEGRVSVLREGSCVITATATDGSGVYAECIVTGLAGIEEIFSESDLFDLYDLNGILIKKDGDREDLKTIVPGIYIIRIGNTMKKIVIR